MRAARPGGDRVIVARANLVITATTDEDADAIYRVLASIHDVNGRPAHVSVVETSRELEQ